MSCDNSVNKYDTTKGAKDSAAGSAGPIDTLYETLAKQEFFKWIPVISLIIGLIALYKK